MRHVGEPSDSTEGVAGRHAVDLRDFPELVVVYLGMRVNRVRGIATLLRLGPQIDAAVADRPDGLLLHERIVYSLRHIGMRQYWRDLESLETFTRSEPHKRWWREYHRSTGGTGFWHETYRMSGGMEGLFIDAPIGMDRFAQPLAEPGKPSSARERLELAAAATVR
jgi:hypothetical protein